MDDETKKFREWAGSLNPEEMGEINSVTESVFEKWRIKNKAKRIHFDEKTGIETWVYGKQESRKHYRRYTTPEFHLKALQGEDPILGENFETFEEQIERIKKTATDLLINTYGISLTVHKGKGYKYLSDYLNKEKTPYGKLAHDDHRVLLAKITDLIKDIKYSSNPDRKLKKTMQLGEAITLYKHYAKSHKSQTQNGSRPKNPEIEKIYQKLSKSQDSAKDLWDVFVTELNALYKDGKVNSQKPNKNQPDTWFIQYKKDIEDKEYNKTITYENFSQRLSRTKK